VTARQGVRVTSSTAGSPSPGYAHLSRPYRHKGIPGWNPAAGVHGQAPEPSPPSSQEIIAARKAARFARFCELRARGTALYKAAQDPGVNVQPKTARGYEKERLAALEATP